MDVQGAALQVLQGMPRLLATVRFLIVELEHRPIYHGQALAGEIVEYLEHRGFELREEIRRDDWFSDVLFVARGLA